MTSAPLTDPLRLDADIRRAAERLAAERLGLATEDGRELARRRDPFDGVRHVAGRSLYEALGEREPLAHELPHRDAQRRWVHELLQARVARDLVIEDAARIHAPDERGGPREKAAALSLDPATSTPGEAAGPGTYAQAMRAVVTASDPPRAALALERAASLAAPVAAVRRERRARRHEAARRLGLAHPWALVLPAEVSDPSGAALARAVLDGTEPLASGLLREQRRRAGGSLSAADTIHAALAREAREGWPAKLGERWLEGVYRAVLARPVRGVRFPAPLGGASFLRAAYSFGYALREQGTARSLPFALARDPYAVGAHRFGALFAASLGEPLLQSKALGVSRRTAVEQARLLRSSLLHGLRGLAVRVALAREPEVDPSTFEELTLRVFGAPLPSALRDAWPEPRVDDLARLAAAVDAHAFLADLVARFDEDWFANPRAGAHLASIACGPLAEPLAPVTVSSLARAFEEALG